MKPLLLLVWLAASPAEAAPGPAIQAATQGRWTLEDDPAVLADRAEAVVTRAVSEMNFAFRGIAKGRLLRLSPACKEYAFTLTDTSFSNTCTGYPPVVAPLDGSLASYTKRDGETVQLRLSLSEEAITIRYQGENGGQTSTFRFEDGAVHHHRRIQSEYLPQDVVFEANYTR